VREVRREREAAVAATRERERGNKISV